jgi:hypothetical protein
MPHTSATSPDISLYPNPVKDHQVNLIFRQHTAGNYHLSLLGSNGQVIWQTGVGLSEGESQMTLKLPPAILPGVYQLLVNDPKRNNLRVALTIE